MTENKFVPTKVRIETRDFFVDDIMEDIRIGKIIVSDSSDWSTEKESKFIESMLLRIPLNPIYLSELDDGSFKIIDGQKRIVAINNMLNKQKPFSSLKYFPEYNGKGFNEFRRFHQRRILESYMTVHYISRHTPDEIKNDIIERIREIKV
jgi:hypothetical protein